MSRFDRWPKSGLYRSRHGLLLGVCKGFADYLGFPVLWMRAVLILCLILSGFWPVMGLYFLAALIMKTELAIPVKSEANRKGAAERLRRRYDNIERRLRNMEDAVTTREFDWDRRLNT